ncbi:MAG: thioredoxin fold domain-containing protein [Candidatus Methanoperedens sp.]|nr:thioredoxin fold domain-containing protein [Candidatus Methanoperedens sp.]
MHIKKLILVFLALIVLFSVVLAIKSDISDAGYIELKGLKFQTNVTLALEAAKVQSMPIFIYARSESCGWCKKFEDETFTNQSAARILNAKFKLVSIDVYKQKNETRNFRVQGTPTEIFLDSNGTEIKRIPGYTDTETFLNSINDIPK